MLDTGLGWFYFRGMKEEGKKAKDQKKQKAKNNSQGAIDNRQKWRAEERLQERKRVKYFFQWLDRDGAAQQLWEILKLVLVADNDSADERERTNMILFYEQATAFFKTTSAPWERKRKKMTREEIMISK